MKNTKRNELAICGFAAVKKLEKNHPEKIKRLYFTQEMAPLFGGICKRLAKNHGIYNQKNNEDLEKLCASVHHQGVVAMIEPPKIIPFDSQITEKWLKNKENAIFLDRIGNANNFGAIIRSAAFFGIKNVVIPFEQEKSLVTTSAYRVAEGGMEYVNIYSVQSSVKFLQALQNKMIKIGTSLEAKKTVSDLTIILQKNKEKYPFLVILGNEENGICDEVKQNCDELVIIEWGGMKNGVKKSQVDSLNVAQASSIIFYELTK